MNYVFSYLLLAAAFTFSGTAAEFYVSPDGSDTWTGKLATPNKAKSDGPFASLEQARDAVREMKKNGADRDITVQVRTGQYHLKKTIVFGLPDSGKGDSTITYEAFPGEKPVFSSGVEITGWKKLDGENSTLPKAARGKVWVANVDRRFLTLFDDSGRLPRARSAGFIPVASNAKQSGKTKLSFPPDMPLPLRNWSNLGDADLIVRPHHAWVVNILPISSIDLKKRTVTTAIPATYKMEELHFLNGTESAWIENVIEALDEPGEWVLNSKEGKLYLWPRVDGSPNGIMAPLLQELVRVEGKIDVDGPTDTPVRNLHFRGLTFTHGETYRVKANDKGLQHDWDLHDKPNALLRFRGAENCVIEKCHFTQSGGGAIRVDLLGRNNKIHHNHIEHIGATGILLCGYGPGTKDVSHNNLVFNNHIHNVGEIYWHSPGVFLWQSGENRVANNLIHHVPYAGIIVSGVMTDFLSKGGDGRELVRTIRREEVGRLTGKLRLEQIRPFLHSHDNRIEYNEIHHAMETLADGNAIYIRGSGAGNIIRRNYIHHLLSTVALQSAIRTDGGQRDTLIAENLIYKCTSQGIQVKLNNRAENNLIVDLHRLGAQR